MFAVPAFHQTSGHRAVYALIQARGVNGNGLLGGSPSKTNRIKRHHADCREIRDQVVTLLFTIRHCPSLHSRTVRAQPLSGFKGASPTISQRTGIWLKDKEAPRLVRPWGAPRFATSGRRSVRARSVVPFSVIKCSFRSFEAADAERWRMPVRSIAFPLRAHSVQRRGSRAVLH